MSRYDYISILFIDLTDFKYIKTRDNENLYQPFKSAFGLQKSDPDEIKPRCRSPDLKTKHGRCNKGVNGITFNNISF